LGIRDESFGVSLTHDLYSAANLELRFEFCSRRVSRPEMLDVESGRMSAESLSHIGRHRYGGLPDLIAEHVLF
jgi:hypothetical protein